MKKPKVARSNSIFVNLPSNTAKFDSKRRLSDAMATKATKRSKTRVVCTLGPASRNVETIKEMLNAGMKIARFNFSHGTHEYHYETLTALRTACEQSGISCGVLLDTKGPEVSHGAPACMRACVRTFRSADPSSHACFHSFIH